MQEFDKWFKKRSPISTKFNWLVGKSVVLIEVGLYAISLKCLLVNILPKRLQNQYLDLPLTCILLLGYLLTFRSLFLACFTDSATAISKKNYLPKEKHEQEKKKREQQTIQDRQQAIQEKARAEEAKKQEMLKKQAGKKSRFCCKRETEKSSVDIKDVIAETKQEDKNVEERENNKVNKKDESNKITNKDSDVKVKEVNSNKIEHSKDCKNSDCQENHSQKRKKSNMCLKCNITKEKDDHHCSMCNKCVYRLDHHCFFIGQCVGDYNYLYFISYVFLSYLMTMLTLLAIIPEVIDFIALEWDKLSCSFIEIFILLLGGLLFHFFTMILLISHLYYISNEITYLENLHNLKKQSYSPLQWICIILKCQSRQKLYHTFTQRWHQIFGNLHFSSLIFPEGTKIKID